MGEHHERRNSKSRSLRTRYCSVCACACVQDVWQINAWANLVPLLLAMILQNVFLLFWSIGNNVWTNYCRHLNVRTLNRMHFSRVSGNRTTDPSRGHLYGIHEMVCCTSVAAGYKLLPQCAYHDPYWPSRYKYRRAATDGRAVQQPQYITPASVRS